MTAKKHIFITTYMVILLLSAFNRPAESADISLEAERHMARGAAAIEHADDKSDYEDAINEFKKAAEIAPDWVNAYYNLGIAQEGAERYQDAITSFKKYIELSPDAPDAGEVQERIFKLEYLAEKSKAKEKKAYEMDLSGEWAFFNPWRKKLMVEHPYVVTMEGDKVKAKIKQHVRGYIEGFEGIVEGDSITGTVTIDWSEYPQDGGRVWTRTMAGAISNAGNTITLEYDDVHRIVGSRDDFKEWQFWLVKEVYEKIK